ncbi:sensor histidine kinase [Sphingomonas xinjiangensis]|uniref:histidine kinase n=1 Tax=Sphingomonas xinjiangensis TaxID=643568 RepID=A0A840YS29_9SPHN|nr:ATP-binding protein [Sphingomonas xinjiangensis]MBB5712489.1 C4-dicarboxylate-specific signal transduction histidine kinase [Sphingomonas xinjiangensis]
MLTAGEPSIGLEEAVPLPDHRSTSAVAPPAVGGSPRERAGAGGALANHESNTISPAPCGDQRDLRAARLAVMGELASSIIHEINQPLSAIVASAEAAKRWIERDRPVLAEASAMLDDVISEVSRVADIVTGLRALARNQEADATLVEMNSIIEEVTAALRPELARLSIRLELSLCSDGLVVLGSRVQIQQVLVNLLRNSIEAIRDEPVAAPAISLTLQPSGTSVVCTIADNGPGVAPSIKGMLFEPLATSKSDGMGMGLAISRSIASSHGGALDLLPTPTGAKFRLTIPRHIAVAGDRQPGQVSSEGALMASPRPLAK